MYGHKLFLPSPYRVGTHEPRVCMMWHMGSCLNVRVENKALGLAGRNEVLIGHTCRYNLIKFWVAIVTVEICTENGQ